MQQNLFGIGYLTWITFLPIIGMVVVIIVPKEKTNAMRISASLNHLVDFVENAGTGVAAAR
ncbi:MAG: hypothetical protein M1469_10990 [Bacteroidetes bacterium]|nr:hypothetical protein [Bacteroidota bacterium]